MVLYFRYTALFYGKKRDFFTKKPACQGAKDAIY